ncbi:phosphotransferase [Pseudomonas yamanorum]|nr:phosphotransferase [Pseudomonas yamanorum]
MDQAGRVRCECVGKLGLASHVNKEILAYNAEVKHLRLGAFAPVLSFNDQGLRGFAAIFYVLADEHTDTFFQLVLTNPEAAIDVLSRVRAALARWSDSRSVMLVSIKEIRRHILSDENFQKIITAHGLERLLVLEEKNVEISEACIHGDLHGGNILVNSDYVPVLIDFGDVGAGYTCLDPITLELSLIFHPDARINGLAAQLESSSENWLDLNVYGKGSLLYPIIKYCREWAYDVAPHDESVLCMAYLFVLKQLKYETVPADVLIKILNGILGRLEDRM